MQTLNLHSIIIHLRSNLNKNNTQNVPVISLFTFFFCFLPPSRWNSSFLCFVKAATAHFLIFFNVHLLSPENNFNQKFSLSSFRAAPKQLTYKWWSQTWWRVQISRNSAWDIWAREKRQSTVVSLPSFMLFRVEREQAALLPDVWKWRRLWSIRSIVSARTSAVVQFALSFFHCAFITRSSVVKLFVMFLSVGLWSGSCKLSTSLKLNSRASRGKSLFKFPENVPFFQFKFSSSLKPVSQFVIPPITPPPSSSPMRRESSSEPSPKRLRLYDASSANHEAQPSSNLINNVFNSFETLENAEHRPQPTEVK